MISRGNIIQITYTNGQKTQMAYDQFNNMISVTDPTGEVTRFTFDSSGNMLCADGLIRQHNRIMLTTA